MIFRTSMGSLVDIFIGAESSDCSILILFSGASSVIGSGLAILLESSIAVNTK